MNRSTLFILLAFPLAMAPLVAGGSTGQRSRIASVSTAAGEAPSWVAAIMGDSVEMLFKVYARFIPNRTRRDGSEFASRVVGQDGESLSEGERKQESA